MILEKNKEIQYMNTRLTFVRWVSDSHQIKDLSSLLMRSIALNILAFKFFERGWRLFQNCLSNTCCWSKLFWAQPLSLEFLAEIFTQSSISYIEFQLLSTKPWLYVLYLCYYARSYSLLPSFSFSKLLK